MTDALEALVDAGGMTHEQAVVAGLQILAGEVDPASEVFFDNWDISQP